MWQYKENIIFALIKVLFKWPFLVFWSRITGVAAFYARCVRRWIERPKREEFGRLWQVIFALWCHLFPLINLPTINVELTYPPPPYVSSRRMHRIVSVYKFTGSCKIRQSIWWQIVSSTSDTTKTGFPSSPFFRTKEEWDDLEKVAFAKAHDLFHLPVV